MHLNGPDQFVVTDRVEMPVNLIFALLIPKGCSSARYYRHEFVDGCSHVGHKVLLTARIHEDLKQRVIDHVSANVSIEWAARLRLARLDPSRTVPTHS